MEINTKDYFVITEQPETKTSELIAEMKKQSRVYCYFSEENSDKYFPPPKEETTRYFKKNVEADEELKNLSANDLEKRGGEYITLRERLIMELEYFKATGKHLDIYNVTLCAGSQQNKK